MRRIEADNGYITINMTEDESYIKMPFEGDASLTVHEITFASERAAKEAMDMLTEALCDKRLN